MLNGLLEIERARRRALKYLNRVHRMLERHPSLPAMAELSINVAIDVLSRAKPKPSTATDAGSPIGRQRAPRPRTAGNVRTVISCFGKHAIPVEEAQPKKAKP